MEVFTKGSITRVELHNFMTYDHIIQHPGPKINFILGRNGSGKSSIVCAIALCCGSSPSFIGRAQHLADFIKHGKDTASVELTLANPEGNPIKVRRVFHRGRCGNECYYNGQKVLLEAYLERIKELNIMTDNLVQFLPQERVIDFSLMSSVQLLENTEKTIGQVNLSKMHEALKKAGNKWGEAAAEIDRLRNSLEEARDQELQLKQEVEALSVREGLLISMGLAKVKKDRLELVQEQTGLKTSKAELEKFSDNLHKMAARVLPFQDKLEKGKTAYSSATKNIVTSKRVIEAAVAGYRPGVYTTELEKLQADNMQDFARLNGLQRSFEERQTKIANHQTAIANLQAQATQTDVQEIRERLSAIAQETKELRDHIDDLSAKKQKFVLARRNLDDEIQTKAAELTRLEQSEDERVKFLRGHNAQLLEAKKWLHENRARLSGKVYGPLFMEIKFKKSDQVHASIIESLVPRELQNTFICEAEGDLDILLTEMVQGRDLRFPVKQVRRGARKSDLMDPERLKRIVHCETVVADLIEAPGPVMQFLCNRFQMDNVPVYKEYNEELLGNYKRAISSSGGKLLAPRMFAANMAFTIRRTCFNNDLATRSQEIRPAQLLNRTMDLRPGKPDSAPLRRQVDELRARCAAASDSEKEINAEMQTRQEEYQAQIREVSGGKQQIQDAERSKRRIDEIQREVARLQAIVVDFDSEKRKASEKVQQRNLTVLQKILDAHKNKGTDGNLLNNAASVSVNFMKLQAEVKKEGGALRTNLHAMREVWMEFLDSMKRHGRHMDSLKDHLNRHVVLINGIKESQNGKLSAEALHQYKELPADANLLENQYKAKRAQLQAAGDINIDARENLENHKAAMRKLEDDIALRGANVEKEKERVARLRAGWMETVEKLADQIGQSFSQYYRSMNLAGDVVLQKPDNPDHFENYGYQIKVSYRPGRPLETLSGQVHSGGEKSVATALYMLAIQELTKCPFRVVDEINQGMDADNERRVFRMIVETASRCGGQYFILSPKLLPDLHLTKDVTVTVIFSGAEMHSGPRLEDWDLINIAKRLKRANPNQLSLPASAQTKRAPPKSVCKRKHDSEFEEEMPSTSASPDSVKENPRLSKRSKRLANVN